ncbi:MAG: NAD(P)H-dependent flavin oxidoreductase [Pseudolabrys sp.]
MPDDFLRRLGIEHPIILAPMAGGAGTPDLVAAVSNTGGLGSWGGAYSSPQQILDAAKQIRALTAKPFAINLFAGGYEPVNVDPAPMLDLMARVHSELGLPPPKLPPDKSNPFADQVQAVIEARPAMFSFAFGVPDADVLARLRKAGIAICGTATTVEEGRCLQAAGVNFIAAQGEEAGAHRGTFLADFDASMVPMRDLTRGLAEAVTVPVIACGGIMDGSDIAEVLALGAVAAQLGTAFLPCPECGTPAAYKAALLAARKDTTVITRAFSGRPARGLRNAFIERTKKEWILSFGQQNDLTRLMRGQAAKQDKPEYLSLWAGRGVTRARQMPAAELVKTLVAEIGRR